MEEAQKTFKEQKESLDSLREKLIHLQILTLIFLPLFVVGILPSIYNFAKVIVQNDEERMSNINVEEKKINVEEKKPILGLNDE